MTIYAIGYEGLTLEQFLERLKANSIERRVDIREAPISRKAGFARQRSAGPSGAQGFLTRASRPSAAPSPSAADTAGPATGPLHARLHDLPGSTGGRARAAARDRRLRPHVSALLRGRLQPLSSCGGRLGDRRPQRAGRTHPGAAALPAGRTRSALAAKRAQNGPFGRPAWCRRIGSGPGRLRGARAR